MDSTPFNPTATTDLPAWHYKMTHHGRSRMATVRWTWSFPQSHRGEMILPGSNLGTSPLPSFPCLWHRMRYSDFCFHLCFLSAASLWTFSWESLTLVEGKHGYLGTEWVSAAFLGYLWSWPVSYFCTTPLVLSQTNHDCILQQKDPLVFERIPTCWVCQKEGWCGKVNGVHRESTSKTPLRFPFTYCRWKDLYFYFKKAKMEDI